MERFEAVIKKVEGINGAFVEIPFDVEQVFGSKRVKVNASFDGFRYRGSVVRMGGCYMIGLTQDIRKMIGKQPGDPVQVELEKDDEARTVEIPEDFKVLLALNPEAELFFEQLSFTKKKEYVQWIIEARKAETRSARVEKAMILLKEGKQLK